jgi:hypothetical protein
MDLKFLRSLRTRNLTVRPTPNIIISVLMLFFGSECCMSGCAVCVYDLYEESMDAYKDAVVAFCSSLTSLGIPKSEWPPRIRGQVSLPTGQDKQRKEVVMSVFEELERTLNAKRQDTNSDEIQADSTRR